MRRLVFVIAAALVGCPNDSQEGVVLDTVMASDMTQNDAGGGTDPIPDDAAATTDAAPAPDGGADTVTAPEDTATPPGDTTTPEGCQAIDPAMVGETCDAANLVVFDGKSCVATCLGCCDCGDFCDKTYSSIGACRADCSPEFGCKVWDGSCDDALPDTPWYAFDGYSCVQVDSCVCEGCPGTYDTKTACESACQGGTSGCEPFISALATCPFDFTGLICPSVACREAPCVRDDECGGDTPWCVQGDCVRCHNDSQCGNGFQCRGGRCVAGSAGCPAPSACTAEGCKLVVTGEVPCPVCMCDDVPPACGTDTQCQSISSVQYNSCVYGACAKCRNDADCQGGHCTAGGICQSVTEHPSWLYGTWVIGWLGGLDHFSYFRFEPGGTLRRGHYGTEDGSAFISDIPPPPCDPGEEITYPLLGTWRVTAGEAGATILHMTVNFSCAEDAGWSRSFEISPGAPTTYNLVDISGEGLTFNAWPAYDWQCPSDMAKCQTPEYPAWD